MINNSENNTSVPTQSVEAKDISEILQRNGRNAVLQRVQQNRRPLVPEPEELQEEGALPQIQTLRALIGENVKLPDQIIHGFLHKGSTAVFGGGSKTNKTFCLMDMALSVAGGVPWWNMNTVKGRVLYLDYELQKPFFADRMNQIKIAKALPDLVFEQIDVWNLRGHAADLSKQIDQILDRIGRQNYSLIIVDPIYKALGKRDENAAGDINSLMNEVDKLAVQSDASVVIGHHFSKGNQAGKDSKDRLSGSGVFARSADAIIILTPHEKKNAYIVDSTLRNFKQLDPFCLEWKYPLMSRNTTLNPAMLKKAGAGQVIFPTEQLLEVLGNSTMTTTEWKKATMEYTGMSSSSFMDKRRDLVSDGKVEETEDGQWRKVRQAIKPDPTDEQKQK